MTFVLCWSPCLMGNEEWKMGMSLLALALVRA